MSNSKGMSSLLVILFVVTLLLAVGIYFVYGNNSVERSPIVSLEMEKNDPDIPRTPYRVPLTIDPNVDEGTYSDPSYGFSFKYPKGWRVSEQGSETNRWINISSPDTAPKGAQQPSIEMTIGVTATDNIQSASEDDLKQHEITDGVLSHYDAEVISEEFITVDGHKAFKYEYKGTSPPYMFDFWGMNVAVDNSIISIGIADFNVNMSLDGSEIAPQILSTVTFE